MIDSGKIYIYVAESGGRYGPATIAELNQWAADGKIGPGSIIENIETGMGAMAMDIPGFGRPETPQPDPLGPQLDDLGIKNPLPKALLSTFVFGFPPAGLIAIAYAVQVKGLERSNQPERARAYAANANRWSNWSISMAVLSSLLLLGFAVLKVLQASRA